MSRPRFLVHFRSPFASLLLWSLGLFAACGATASAVEMEFGFAKVDVTPTEPVRLSGYGNRATPTSTIVHRLYVRAMALKPADGEASVLVAVDSIGCPAVFTEKIAERLKEDRGIARERFVLSTTHSHTTPHLVGGLGNLFAVELTEEESAAAERYTATLADAIVKVAGEAIDALAPGKLAFGEGEVDFAVNRRVIQDGKWTGFGETENGSVDRSVPMLRVLSPEGELRGLVCNYACHCTTLGPADEVCGDWAGYAASFLETDRSGTVALVTVGCGADANPRARGTRETAVKYGRSLADEVLRLLGTDLDPIDAAPRAAFDHVDLPIEVPTEDAVREMAKSDSVQTRRHGEQMLATLEAGGELRDSYPVPVQTWRFGDELAMVFLAGEVVSDYSLRLKREIDDARHVWVTAYANDVMAYVVSKRLRPEGGYEVDFSMIYYGLPGRWAENAEELLVGKVLELVKKK
jgi:neutral ceramidase